MIRLALAYLLRRPVQVLAILGVAVGLMALLVVLAVMNGLIEADRASARGPLSDLLLIPAAGSDPPRWEQYRRALDGVPELRAAAPHLVAYAVLGLRGGERLLTQTRSSDLNGVQVVGVDLDREPQVGDFARALEQARMHPVRDRQRPFAVTAEGPFQRPGILVSDTLAGALALQRGEIVELGTLPPLLPPAGEELLPYNGRFAVAGTYAGSDYGLSMDRVYLERSGLDGMHYNLLNEEGADFSEILIELRAGVTADQGKQALAAALERAGLPLPGGELGGELQTWEERRVSYLNAIENERRVISLVLFFIVVVAAFGLFATLSALVREKVRDLGVLSALGCPPWQRGALLLGVGALGSAAGTVLGYGAAWWLVAERAAVEAFLRQRFGIEIFRPDLYVVNGLPALWEAQRALPLAGAAFLVGVLFTLLPAARAASLSPVEALSYE